MLTQTHRWERAGRSRRTADRGGWCVRVRRAWAAQAPAGWTRTRRAARWSARWCPGQALPDATLCRCHHYRRRKLNRPARRPSASRGRTCAVDPPPAAATRTSRRTPPQLRTSNRHNLIASDKPQTRQELRIRRLRRETKWVQLIRLSMYSPWRSKVRREASNIDEYPREH